MGTAPVLLRTEYNSDYARDRNNGVLWAGRGVSTLVSAGGELRAGPLSAAVRPVLTYQENGAFEVRRVALPGYSRELYPGHPGRIDWPLRHGEASFWTVDPGPSHVRLDAYGAAIGLSNENLWWGPAQRNPLLLSNTAPGFPHVFLGTSAPVDVGVGEVTAEVVWGGLRESDWFDADASNDRRLFGGLIASFRPAVFPGLRIGAARARVSAYDPDAMGWKERVLAPFGGPDEAGEIRLTSVFARWILPASRLELYGELVPSDYHWGEEDAAGEERDRHHAYVVGLGKVFTWDRRWIHVYGELLQLQNRISLRDNRPTATYYVDEDVPHGHTHAGQMLGAASGPGSEMQLLGVDLYASWGSVGLSAERLVYDDDAYWEQKVRNFGFHGHDVEVAMRLRQTLFVGPARAFWSVGVAHRRNRSFVGLISYHPEMVYGTDINWTGSLGLTWTPGG
ncbi:MAG: capsule assembly Wzi family protein [Gemmatimonadota bacterium]